MRTSYLILLSAGTLTACRGDSVVGPFGLRLRERPRGGSVAAAIRRDAVNHHYCPSVPTPSTGWTMRALTKPAGRVPLPPHLETVSAPTSEVTFFARDMTAGAFVFEAPGGDSVHLAFLQIAAPGDRAVRAGAFATTRTLRDSLVGALLSFQPDLR